MKNKTFIIKTSNNNNSKAQTVIFEGDLGIKNAASIKNAIQTLKFSGSSIIMHLENVEKLDITTIQTINALKIALKSKGINTEVLAEVPSDIEKLMKNTGFNKTL